MMWKLCVPIDAACAMDMAHARVPPVTEQVEDYDMMYCYVVYAERILLYDTCMW
jgi:hypothetical protein